MGRLEKFNNSIFPSTYGWKALKYMVPAVGIEPTRPQGTRDFESRASTSSTTPAHQAKIKKNGKIKRIIMGGRSPVKKK
jgi:hypothetical protein